MAQKMYLEMNAAEAEVILKALNELKDCYDKRYVEAVTSGMPNWAMKWESHSHSCAELIDRISGVRWTK